MSFNKFCENNNLKNESDYSEKNKNVENESQNKQLNDDVMNFYNKYKEYSSDELLNELISKTNEQKQNGEFNYQQLSSMVDKLSPFLNEQQKNNMRGIMEKIK